MKKSVRNTFYILLLPIILMSVDPISISYEQTDVKLAGNAIFPAKEHNDWLKFQQDLSVNSEEKIKSTVNSFFILKYESWLRGTLLDFVFLFNQADIEAYKDYAYERGLMHYLLTGWIHWDALLKHYEYKPIFYSFEEDAGKATVGVRANGKVVVRKTPDHVDNHSWMEYTFNLMLVDDRWLINRVTCADEIHTAYPHGTDFIQLARDVSEKIKAYAIEEARAKAEHEERMKNDPKYKEFVERRLVERQKYYSEESKKETERIIVYKEIAGKYKFEKLGILLIYVEGNYLAGKWERDDKGVILQRSDNPFEFEFRYRDGKIFNLQFLKDQEGKISKCLLINDGLKCQGIRMNGLK